MVWPFRRRRAAAEEKASAFAPQIAWSYVGAPIWKPRDYDTFAKEGYSQNPVVHLCVEEIAKAVSSLPLITQNGKGEVVESPPFADLLIQASRDVTFRQFLHQTVCHYLIAGNAYIEAMKTTSGKVTEIYSHFPNRVEVIPDERGEVAKFEYTVNGLKKEMRREFRPGQPAMAQIKRFNPLNDWYGLSALEPIARDIDIHNEASSHMMALYQNGASPSGALVLKPVKNSDGGEQSAPQSVVDSAMEALTSRFAGAKNAGKPMVLGGNVDWKQLGMTPVDIGHAKNMDQSARNICSGIGYPHILAVAGEATFNNRREAMLSFYEDTVIPVAETVLDTLNVWLLPEFAKDLRLSVVRVFRRTGAVL